MWWMKEGQVGRKGKVIREEQGRERQLGRRKTLEEKGRDMHNNTVIREEKGVREGKNSSKKKECSKKINKYSCELLYLSLF